MSRLSVTGVIAIIGAIGVMAACAAEEGGEGQLAEPQARPGEPELRAVEQAASSGEVEVEATYPPSPWVAPVVRADDSFPNGVLSFATASQFATFFTAFDEANGSNAAASDSSGTTPFSASSTFNATVSYKSFTLRLEAGQTLDVGSCDLEGASFSGNTFLRLYQGGLEVSSNDDNCGGAGSRISYTAPSSNVYQVRMGCSGTQACSGVVGYAISSPPGGPSQGTRSYESGITNSATIGFSTQVLYLSQGQLLDIGTCGLPGASFTGDTFLRLIDADGKVEVTASDDACGGVGSRITYRADRTGYFEIRLGCYAGVTCSGTVVHAVSGELSAEQMLPPGFQSAKAYLAAARPGEPPGDAIYDVDYGELTDDLKAYLTEDDSLRSLVDPELQVVVEDTLYQLTNVGVFQVDMFALDAYRAWLAANSYAINTDPTFVSIPGEVALGDGSYQVMPGVVRTVGGWGIPSAKLVGDDDGCSTCVAGASMTGANANALDAGKQKPPGPIAIAGEIGRISYWFGKVNAHKSPSGGWLRDDDCVSGATLDPLTYCRKFFPGTTSVTAVPVSSKPPNLWNNQGCGSTFSGDGLQEWTCNDDGTAPPTCNQPPSVTYSSFPVGSGFNRSESTYFGNRRFVFQAQAPGFRLNIGRFEVGFHKIDIKAKLQRKKRFLGIGYWGPSYADEIVLGVENMKLETDYIIPSPQTYNTLPKPKFNKLADYKLGNWVVKVANISFNVQIASYPITSANLASWANGLFNSLIGSAYTNLWLGIERNIMDAIDSGFRTRYAAYTKMVDAINAANQLRWALGQGEKPRCYSHQNTWRFSANGGFKYTQNGGVPGAPGTPPAKVNFKYSMKAGSFYGRARIGSSWYGIRMVRQ